MSRAELPILVVDDEKNIRRTLRMVLEGEGYEVLEAGTFDEAAQLLSTHRLDAILLDVKLLDQNGIELLERIKNGHYAGAAGPAGATPGTDRDVPVIMISGHATVEDAVRATRTGAFDFLQKPLDRDRVLVTVRNAIDRRAMTREVETLRAAVAGRHEMVGTSAVMQDLFRQIAKVAPTKGRVLITGESGTGKELIARAVHQSSTIAGGAFVKVNCAAIPPELIESELFGHERGAFTGAVGKKKGLFEVADGGTIFLDEIGDMSLSAQAKVLRVLQQGELVRVGGEKTIQVDCRVIAATNKDLDREVAGGRFREDLYFRLNVIPIRSPALRERLDDVPQLAESFVKQCCEENGFRPKRLTPEVVSRLTSYPWPGNVRELRNVIERLVIMSDDEISVRDLPPYLGAGGPAPISVPSSGGAPAGAVPQELDPRRYVTLTLREFRDEIEREFIRLKLREYDWNISRTAQALGIERTNLHKKLRALGIERDEVA
jgi:two-component system, NtrC family, nitrogen regulation response regulator NtrX